MSKFAQYSLLLVAYLTKNYSDKYISLKDIASEHNISFSFLKQVALNLKKNGILESLEGVNGGYKLINEPSKITLDGIIKSIQEEKVPYICKNHKNCLLNCFCGLKYAWEQAQVDTLKKLSKYKLSDFIC